MPTQTTFPPGLLYRRNAKFSNRVTHDSSLPPPQYSPSAAPNAAPLTAHLGLHLARQHAVAQQLPVADLAGGGRPQRRSDDAARLQQIGRGSPLLLAHVLHFFLVFRGIHGLRGAVIDVSVNSNTNEIHATRRGLCFVECTVHNIGSNTRQQCRPNLCETCVFLPQEGEEIDFFCDGNCDGGGGDLSTTEAEERQPRPPMQ